MGIEKQTVSVRLPEEVLERIKQLQELHQRSRSNMIHLLIVEGIKHVTKDSETNK